MKTMKMKLMIQVDKNVNTAEAISRFNAQLSSAGKGEIEGLHVSWVENVEEVPNRQDRTY